jgi:hypothetical protein
MVRGRQLLLIFRGMQNAIPDFLNGYEPAIRDRANRYRQLILKLLPGIREELDAPARMLAFGYGPGYTDMICTLIPSKKGLKLGLYKGSELPDPQKLLAGSGKVHRHVVLEEDTDINALTRLLQHAHAAYLARKK